VKKAEMKKTGAKKAETKKAEATKATVQTAPSPKDKVKVTSVSNDVALANIVAHEWLQQIATRPPDSGNYCVALSGGRIAKTFSSAVANLAKARNLDFKSVHFFWGDERCVPPTDAESNFAIAQELIFTPLAIPETQIHRIRGENDPPKAAKEAEAELRRFASTSPDKQPVFDLIFLGMGEDGHTASLFPTEPAKMASNKAVYRAVTATKPPPHRVTLGYPTIASAKEVWVLASGAGKENALADSLKADGKTPLGRVLKLRSRTRVFTDIQLPKL
jgi:6-phosphogluconolactonase